MTPDIERLAKEAGFAQVTIDYILGPLGLAKFAALIAEDMAQMVLDMSCGEPLEWAEAEKAAAAIRAKFALSN